VEPPAKDLEREKGEAEGRRPNLEIVKQLDMKFRDKNGRILGIIGWAVGEKDGKLMMVTTAKE
jgi:hypothetical protein